MCCKESHDELLEIGLKLYKGQLLISEFYLAILSSALCGFKLIPVLLEADHNEVTVLPACVSCVCWASGLV